MENTISLEELLKLMDREMPNYSSPDVGYIVVNTLPTSSFEMEHIPMSVNVPEGNIARLSNSYDHSKEIIVYCASAECSSSTKSAKKLQDIGFRNVREFEGGMEEWKLAGQEVASGIQRPREVQQMQR